MPEMTPTTETLFKSTPLLKFESPTKDGIINFKTQSNMNDNIVLNSTDNETAVNKTKEGVSKYSEQASHTEAEQQQQLLNEETLSEKLNHNFTLDKNDNKNNVSQTELLSQIFDDFLSTMSLKTILNNFDMTLEGSESHPLALSALRGNNNKNNSMDLNRSSFESDFEKPFHLILFESFDLSI